MNISDIKRSLNKVGIKKDKSIFLIYELFRLGKIDGVKRNSHYFKTYLDCIIQCLGKNETLTMNTYSFDTLRFNKNFNLLNKKTTAGKLSDTLLKKKRIIRSLHPVFSVASIGRHKKFICSKNSQHNYGKNSPYDRLLKLDSTILSFGLNIVDNPFLHCAEYASGVPYFYNKIFNKNVYKGKKKINKKFVFFMRYKNLNIRYNHSKIEKILHKKKIIKKIKLGSGFITTCNAKLFYNEICEILKKDIHGLLIKIPNYSKNQFPLK